jgi:hypothetical protein
MRCHEKCAKAGHPQVNASHQIVEPPPHSSSKLHDACSQISVPTIAQRGIASFFAQQ